jgi:hypothetical protein
MNIFSKIDTFLKDVVEEPVAISKKIETIFEQVTADAPELRAVLVGLVAKLEAVGGDATKDIASEGLNLPGDIQLITDSVSVVQYFKVSVLPVIEQVYGQIMVDLAPAPVPAAPAIAAVAESGPGLKAVTAD